MSVYARREKRDAGRKIQTRSIYRRMEKREEEGLRSEASREGGKQRRQIKAIDPRSPNDLSDRQGACRS